MRKYELVQLDRAVELIFSEKALASMPFQYYAIPHHLALEEKTQKAAFFTLPHPLPTDIPEDFALLSGPQLYQPLIYRVQCAKVAQTRLGEITWSPSQVWFKCAHCPPGNSHRTFSAPSRTDQESLYEARNRRTKAARWFSLFLSQVTPLLQERPWPTVFVGRLSSQSIYSGRNLDKKYGLDHADCESIRYASSQWDEFVKTTMAQHFDPELQKV
jgi:hypothetical protein